MFDPDKCHVKFESRIDTQSRQFPRCYTLTHSDVTGDLFLMIARDYDRKKINNLYTRIMRDEVLGEWEAGEPPVLHIHCHVSGGLVIGPAKWRDNIFKEHLPMVLAVICYGDREFLHHHPERQESPICVHFHAKQAKLDRVEKWGTIQDYQKSDNYPNIRNEE